MWNHPLISNIVGTGRALEDRGGAGNPHSTCSGSGHGSQLIDLHRLAASLVQPGWAAAIPERDVRSPRRPTAVPDGRGPSRSDGVH